MGEMFCYLLQYNVDINLLYCFANYSCIIQL